MKSGKLNSRPYVSFKVPFSLNHDNQPLEITGRGIRFLNTNWIDHSNCFNSCCCHIPMHWLILFSVVVLQVVVFWLLGVRISIGIGFEKGANVMSLNFIRFSLCDFRVRSFFSSARLTGIKFVEEKWGDTPMSGCLYPRGLIIARRLVPIKISER